MSAQNSVNLTGRITKELEKRKSQSGSSYVAFTLAIRKKYIKSDGLKANFIPCVAYGKTADLICEYSGKGKLIGVQGDWESGSYDDKDGRKIYTHTCEVDSVQFLESRSVSDNQSYIPQEDTIPDYGNDTLDISSDDLPFR